MGIPDHSFYDEEYFENGIVAGKSGYTNYQWLPDLTIPMAHHLVMGLNLTKQSRVLDYGCAKGYLTRAFRLLGIKAFGVDVSEYALSHCHESVKDYCSTLESELYRDPKEDYDYVVAKDVFEHIDSEELPGILRHLSKISRSIFIVVPLGTDSQSNKFVIPAYHMDTSHITIKDRSWWEGLVAKHFDIESSSLTFDGCKENWTSLYPDGNLFIIARSRYFDQTA